MSQGAEHLSAVLELIDTCWDVNAVRYLSTSDKSKN